jgi:aldehyde dehydrogenase (NAD+)
MAPAYTHDFNHAGYKGKVEIPTGLFFSNEWHISKDSNAKTIELVRYRLDRLQRRLDLR